MKCKRNRKSNWSLLSSRGNLERGITLIELLVYIFIFAILITTITLFAMSFIEANSRSQVRREVPLGAYSAVKAMVYEIKRANKIYLPTSVFNSHPGQLSLETGQGLPSEEQMTYIDFYLDSDNKLYIKREGQNPQLLISENLKITNLEFEYLALDSESIKINLTLEYDTTAPEYQYSYTLTSTASVRK